MNKTPPATTALRIKGAPHSASKRHEHAAASQSSVERTGKRPKNLTLDPEAVARGEAYGRRHGTSMSQVVNGLLKALPAAQDIGSNETMLAELSPLTRRLHGIADRGTTDRHDYRAHLIEKYGSGDKKSRR